MLFRSIKLQMLTTIFEELKMGDNESFDSFYGKLNEIVIAKLNLGEKIEDAKKVRKILRSLPESFHVKVSKHMSWDCLLTRQANFLLLKPSPREWMTPPKKMMWRRR